MLARITNSAARLRDRLSTIAYRMQLGPTNGADWRAFKPRH